MKTYKVLVSMALVMSFFVISQVKAETRQVVVVEELTTTVG
ncbi:MAG: hypothetical protein PHX21_01165 [bacterium]|nr:hypothetical protein [bacterium]